jgi:hypothetical protein
LRAAATLASCAFSASLVASASMSFCSSLILAVVALICGAKCWPTAASVPTTEATTRCTLVSVRPAQRDDWAEMWLRRCSVAWLLSVSRALRQATVPNKAACTSANSAMEAHSLAAIEIFPFIL